MKTKKHNWVPFVLFLVLFLASIWLGFFFHSLVKGTWAEFPECLTSIIAFVACWIGMALNAPHVEDR
jgi:uncharacterized membrane protein